MHASIAHEEPGRRVALGSSVVVFGVGLAFAVGRLISSGGGGYSTLFLLLGLIAVICVAGAVASLALPAQRGGGGMGKATVLLFGAALVLLLFGLSVGFRG